MAPWRTADMRNGQNVLVYAPRRYGKSSLVLRAAQEAHAALKRLLGATYGHPYATQELSYYTWELVAPGSVATPATGERALDNVLRSEHNHLAQLWDEASRQQRLVMLALACWEISTVPWRVER